MGVGGFTDRASIFVTVAEPSSTPGEDFPVWPTSSRKGLPFKVSRTFQNKATSWEPKVHNRNLLGQFMFGP